MAKDKTLLTAEELDTCQQIASQDDIHGKRAQVLLALNEGQTRATVGEQTGLNTGQVQYILTKFRQQRMDMFPTPEGDAIDSPKDAKVAEEITEKKGTKAKKKKSKKSKSKKAKKDKKAKKTKGKKSTKAKKSKKQKRKKKKK